MILLTTWAHESELLCFLRSGHGKYGAWCRFLAKFYGVKNILCVVVGVVLLHGAVQPLMLIYVVKYVMVREGLKFHYYGV